MKTIQWTDCSSGIPGIGEEVRILFWGDSGELEESTGSYLIEDDRGLWVDDRGDPIGWYVESWSPISDLQTENESLRARVAELEEANNDLRIYNENMSMQMKEAIRIGLLQCDQLTQLRCENQRLKEELLADSGYLACECGRLLSDEVDFSHCDCGKAVDEIFPHVKPKNLVTQLRREIEAMREERDIYKLLWDQLDSTELHGRSIKLKRNESRGTYSVEIDYCTEVSEVSSTSWTLCFRGILNILRKAVNDE